MELYRSQKLEVRMQKYGSDGRFVISDFRLNKARRLLSENYHLKSAIAVLLLHSDF